MRKLTIALCLAVFSLVVGWNCELSAQQREDQIVRDSIAVLDEIMRIPADGIPRSMLQDANAVVIVPKVIKGSFVVGARHGNGVLLVRGADGGWHAPAFISLTGGNVGWQVGIQSTDVILVFKSRESVESLLAGKFTVGADAAVAAGPVGRQAAAATDGRLKAEVYSYSRSRGVFLGVSIDGSVIKMDPWSNSRYYPPTNVPGQVFVPDAARQLTQQVIAYASPSSDVQAEPLRSASDNQQLQEDAIARQHAMSEAEHVRDQLARIAPEMYRQLDGPWQEYLALPAEVFHGSGHPSVESLQACLDRFEIVRRDARYASLANHPEFQSTYGLLRHYIQELSQSQGNLVLPAPPTYGDR